MLIYRYINYNYGIATSSTKEKNKNWLTLIYDMAAAGLEIKV